MNAKVITQSELKKLRTDGIKRPADHLRKVLGIDKFEREKTMVLTTRIAQSKYTRLVDTLGVNDYHEDTRELVYKDENLPNGNISLSIRADNKRLRALQKKRKPKKVTRVSPIRPFVEEALDLLFAYKALDSELVFISVPKDSYNGNAELFIKIEQNDVLQRATGLQDDFFPFAAHKNGENVDILIPISALGKVGYKKHLAIMAKLVSITTGPITCINGARVNSPETKKAPQKEWLVVGTLQTILK